MAWRPSRGARGPRNRPRRTGCSPRTSPKTTRWSAPPTSTSQAPGASWSPSASRSTWRPRACPGPSGSSRPPSSPCRSGRATSAAGSSLCRRPSGPRWRRCPSGRRSLTRLTATLCSRSPTGRARSSSPAARPRTPRGEKPTPLFSGGGTTLSRTASCSRSSQGRRGARASSRANADDRDLVHRVRLALSGSGSRADDMYWDP
mmetsp:Transcript_11189/g.38106  ORF Transcript_11189/g.38106 Transcript_11189/m.38106 type:complete len:203 (-) Transcript_11189:290-898(-)